MARDCRTNWRGFAPGSRLSRSSPGWGQNTESPITLTTLGTNLSRTLSLPESLGWRYWGDWSPDGRSIALLTQSKAGNRRTLVAIALQTGIWHVLLSDTVLLSLPRWSLAGEALYYLRNGDELWKLPMASTGLPRAAPELLQGGFGADGSDLGITADGRKMIYRKDQSHSNLWLATRSRGQRAFTTTQLTHGTAAKTMPHLSPDGRLIVFVQSEQDKGDVFVLPIEGGTPRRVTYGGVARSEAVWAPDGRRIAFVATINGVSNVHTVSLDGGEERVYERANLSSPELAWAPQPRILYHAPGNQNFHWLDPATKAEEPLVANDSVGWMFAPSISPDGRYVAVWWNRAPRRAWYLISLGDGSQRELFATAGAVALGWSPDSKFVYIGTAGSPDIRRVPISGGEGVVVATQPFKTGDCNVTERSSELVLLCNVAEASSDIWMMENFEPAQAH